LDCPRCGHVYSTYEFIKQGFEEHGEEVVRAAFSLKRTAILQINPLQNIICRNCRLHISVAGRGFYPGYDYEYYQNKPGEPGSYACCRAPWPDPWPNLQKSVWPPNSGANAGASWGRRLNSYALPRTERMEPESGGPLQTLGPRRAADF